MDQMGYLGLKQATGGGAADAGVTLQRSVGDNISAERFSPSATTEGATSVR